MKAKATFTPQAWMRDYAVTVDPEGPTEWITEFEGLTDKQVEAILETGHDNFDLLKGDPAAPEWVREWSGPFEIHVTEMADEWTAAERGFSLSDDEQNGVTIAVNTILRGSWTPEGMERWWNRPREQLGGHTPKAALPYRPTEVIELALSGMMQGGS